MHTFAYMFTKCKCFFGTFPAVSGGLYIYRLHWYYLSSTEGDAATFISPGLFSLVSNEWQKPTTFHDADIKPSSWYPKMYYSSCGFLQPTMYIFGEEEVVLPCLKPNLSHHLLHRGSRSSRRSNPVRFLLLWYRIDSGVIDHRGVLTPSPHLSIISLIFSSWNIWFVQNRAGLGPIVDVVCNGPAALRRLSQTVGSFVRSKC